MHWWNGLGKNHRGSRPRCIMLVDGTREEVARRLTQLVGLPCVTVSRDDRWMPYGKPVWKSYGKWIEGPAEEAQLHKSSVLADKLDLLEGNRDKLHDWWLASSKGKTTPNWDIASTCTICCKQGLLLVEAKAHGKELDKSGKSKKRNMSPDSLRNHEKIKEAIIEANGKLKCATNGHWNLSRDSHYQISNRFAWAWKLASLGIPVVLLYLGFLNARDVADVGPLFSTEAEWEEILKGHCKDVVDNNCWGRTLDIAGTPLIPSIRAIVQPPI